MMLYRCSKHWEHIVGCLLVLVLMVGCASQRSPDVYSRDDALKPQTVMFGEVVDVREITIEGTKSPAGALAGVVLGGLAGSAIGGGSGRDIAIGAGAIAGSMAGSATEEGVTRKKGQQLTIKLDDNRMITVVQEYGKSPLDVGIRVMITRSGKGDYRVIPAY